MSLGIQTDSSIRPQPRLTPVIRRDTPDGISPLANQGGIYIERHANHCGLHLALVQKGIHIYWTLYLSQAASSNSTPNPGASGATRCPSSNLSLVLKIGSERGMYSTR